MRSHHRPWFRGEPPDLSKIPDRFGGEERWQTAEELAEDRARWSGTPGDPYEDVRRAMGMFRREAYNARIEEARHDARTTIEDAFIRLLENWRPPVDPDLVEVVRSRREVYRRCRT